MRNDSSALGTVAVLAMLVLSSACEREEPLSPIVADAPSAAASATTASLSTGGIPGLSAGIDTPAGGSLVAASGSPFDFRGTVSTDQGSTTLVYVLDFGVSSDLTLGPAGEALAALNERVIDRGVVNEVAVVGFAMDAFWADVTPAEERGMFTGPETDANGSGTPDVVEVLESAFIEYAGGGGSSCPTIPDEGFDGEGDPDCPAPDAPSTDPGFSGFRDFNISASHPEFRNLAFGVRQICSVATEASNSNVTAIIVSAGHANDGGGVLDWLPCDVPVLIHAVAPPWASCTSGGSSGTLQEVAHLTGGTCTQLEERDGWLISAAELFDVVRDLAPERAFLESITLAADGGHGTALGTEDPNLPVVGPAEVAWLRTLELEPGTPEICVTATRSAGIGGESTVDCINLRVRSVHAHPESSTADLGQDSNHTVTAMIDSEPGLQVAFEVIDGPNAGIGGSVETDSEGSASFAWQNPNLGAGGLGTDVIEACFTDSLGNAECARAEHEWANLTLPTAACAVSLPGRTGSTGKGAGPAPVLALSASHPLDPEPEIFLQDSGSDRVFGPFQNGAEVRYLELPEATSRPEGEGTTPSGIFMGVGAPEILAVDFSGNTAVAACEVAAAAGGDR